MKKAIWLIVSVGVVYFLSSIESHSKPEALPVFGSFVLGAILVIAMFSVFYRGLVRWRTASRMWFVPSLICMLILGGTYLTAQIGRAISDSDFKKHTAEFSRIAEAFKSKTISCSKPCNTQLETLAVENMPSQIRQVRGAYCDDGGVILLFLYKSDVPLLHVGYLFKEYGERSNCNTGMIRPEQRLPYIRHIVGSWYRFSDQPGL